MTWNFRALLLAAATIALLPLLQAGVSGARAHFVGGTGADLPAKTDGRIELSAENDFVFFTRDGSVHVPFRDIHTLEYGQKVDRRYVEAILISPLMLLAKKRTHFLTIGFTDRDGKEQALIFRVGSNDVRLLLIGLETKTGRKVEYQDDEARKAGKG